MTVAVQQPTELVLEDGHANYHGIDKQLLVEVVAQLLETLACHVRADDDTLLLVLSTCSEAGNLLRDWVLFVGATEGLTASQHRIGEDKRIEMLGISVKAHDAVGTRRDGDHEQRLRKRHIGVRLDGLASRPCDRDRSPSKPRSA